MPQVEVRALRESEREECVALWRAVWPGDNDAYFRRYLYTDSEWLPYYTQVAIIDHKLVSAAHICRRVVACGDFRLTMGGIANVATLPEYRGRGCSTACLERVIEVMEADAMDFSLLFTGINDYYARLGFETLPRKRLRGAVRTGWTPRPSPYRVRPMSSSDLPEVFAVYDYYNRTRPIAVQRSPAYWRDWIGFRPGQLQEPPLIAEDSEGGIVGYISYQVNFYQGHQINEDYAYIVEYGAKLAAPQEEAVAAALFAAVAERALAAGKRELHLSIPLESHIVEALGGILEKSEENVTLSGMARLLHRDNLLRSLLMELNERWIAGGRPAGDLTFQTPYGPMQLITTERLLRIEACENHPDSLPQSALFGLLFGMAAPTEVTSDRTQLPLLRTLFPQQAGTYWAADGF